jgi:sugar O-acyltransferase (sialic acid O-acetyltransferase NeuD family)
VNTQLGLLGAGHQALEVAEFATTMGQTVIFHAVDTEYLDGSRTTLIDLACIEVDILATPVVAAVGAPGLKRKMIGTWGGHNYATVVAHGASVSRSATVGQGSVIGSLAVISAGAIIGKHVLVNIGATVSHTSSVGDFVTLSPGVHVAGDCVIDEGTFIGIGAVLSHGIHVPPGSVIGAGAVVIESLGESGVYVGSPARLVRTTEEWLRDL